MNLKKWSFWMLITTMACSFDLNAQSHRERERLDDMSRELNLSPRQYDDMKALQDEQFMQRNRFRDKMKAERRAMRDNHDRKLRSILDEKQYYAFKQKQREHRKHKMRKHHQKLRNMPRGNARGRGGHRN